MYLYTVVRFYTIYSPADVFSTYIILNPHGDRKTLTLDSLSVGAVCCVGNTLYYTRIERKWQMLARYSNSPAFTETENVMTKFCGDTRDTIHEYVHEFLLYVLRYSKLLIKIVKSIRNVTLCTHVQLVFNGVRDQYLFISSVLQQPSHQDLFIPVKITSNATFLFLL